MEYSALAKSYNTLCYPNQLRGLLAAFFKTDQFQGYNKYELVKTINSLLLDNYDGEQILKYRLANEFRKKKYIAAFEVKAKNSRTDFLVINGDTKSFEVKSKLDNLNRLEKQTTDYDDVFEYNSVVIDRLHLNQVQNILPEYYGIWYFEGKKKVIFREAKYSPKISAKAQLELFNKKELNTAFSETKIDFILSKYDSSQVNKALKDTLKKRYTDRWAFLQANWDQIFPIDVQFFFNTNVKPEIIYG
jgi:hypothetical protein